MALLGRAAMVLSFDVTPEALAEHDHWHSHEHLRERMSIPGFLRGSRWIALTGEPHYFVMYEVDQTETLTSLPYLDRLNNPSPWTTKMMAHYRGMKRGFCSVIMSSGWGLGHVGLLLRFASQPEKEGALRDFLCNDLLPALVAKAGLVSAHLLAPTLRPEITQEQRIRGNDDRLDWVLLVTGYSGDSIEQLRAHDLSGDQLKRLGAINVATGVYQLRHSLLRAELTEAERT